MISFKKAQGLVVVARREGAIVGKFDDFQFDLQSRHIYGYRVKGSGMFAKAGGVLGERLDHIGRDVAFVEAEDDIEWTGGARNAEDGRAWASQYRGTKVMSRAGVSLGVIDDFVFEPGNDRLAALILDGSRMVEADDTVATGPAAVIIEHPETIQHVESDTPAADWRSLFSKS